MSTKTLRKRIALAAVLALGSGVLSATASHAAGSAKSTAKTVASSTRPSIGGMNVGMNGGALTSVLASLVKAGTITQAQSDAITKALAAARPALPATGGQDGDGPGFGGRGMGGMNNSAQQAVILSTLGIDAATLQADMQKGQSLATIAGSKKDALIAALVAFENKEIDAAVTAGTLTSAQATTEKANVTARVTAQVNATPGQGRMGGMMGGRHGFGAPSTTNGTTGTTGTTTN